MEDFLESLNNGATPNQVRGFFEILNFATKTFGIRHVRENIIDMFLDMIRDRANMEKLPDVPSDKVTDPVEYVAQQVLTAKVLEHSKESAVNLRELTDKRFTSASWLRTYITAKLRMNLDYIPENNRKFIQYVIDQLEDTPFFTENLLKNKSLEVVQDHPTIEGVDIKWNFQIKGDNILVEVFVDDERIFYRSGV